MFEGMKHEIREALPKEVEAFNEIFPNIKAAGRLKTEINKRIRSFEKRGF
jgi:hypothetical protein